MRGCMTQERREFYPGSILHEVIIGAFKAQGWSLEGWCEKAGITPANARNATFGHSRGPIGRKNLEAIIDAAGRDFIREAYRRRLDQHHADVVGRKSA